MKREDLTNLGSESMSAIEVDKKRTLNIILGIQGLWVFSFFISACDVASNANMGFNVIITALMFIAYEAYFVYIVNKKKPIEGTVDMPTGIKPMVGGFLIGSTVMLIFLALMTAVYWGQYAGCEHGYNDVDGYSCTNRSGMKSACAFASLLFVTMTVEVGLLVKWKDDLFTVSEAGNFENFQGEASPTNIHSFSAYDPNPGAGMGGSQADL